MATNRRIFHLVYRQGSCLLTLYSIISKMKKGLREYLYVSFMKPDYGQADNAPYGKSHHQKEKRHDVFCCQYNAFVLESISQWARNVILTYKNG